LRLGRLRQKRPYYDDVAEGEGFELPPQIENTDIVDKKDALKGKKRTSSRLLAQISTKAALSSSRREV
jgi:hypothetical protein